MLAINDHLTFPILKFAFFEHDQAPLVPQFVLCQMTSILKDITFPGMTRSLTF